MEIHQKLLKFKFHILFALVFSLLLVSLILLAPRFVTLLAYFWPLFLSTALFLVAVVFFGKTSQPATDASGDKPGEGLLDYVAGQPEHTLIGDHHIHSTDTPTTATTTPTATTSTSDSASNDKSD